MATMGATVLKVSTMPISSKITLWGFDRKVLSLLMRMADGLARLILFWSI